MKLKLHFRKKKLLPAAALICASLLTCALPAYAAENLLPSGAAVSEIGEKIEDYVAENQATTAGLAVSVFDAKETLYHNYFGYADIENAIPVDADTVFEWGSATKMFVWVSVMQLYEQGLIDLNKDIREYLPEGFLQNLNYDTSVTMLHLMNHTAGFQEQYVDLFVKDAKAPSMESLEAALRAHEPEQIFEPGVYAAYSNWGVALAAYIVECITGENFADYVHAHIFEPLGMEQSAVAADLSDNEQVRQKRGQLQCYTTERTLIPDCNYHITLYPAGMCTSPLSDFEIFAKALLDKKSALFQSEATWEEMFTATSYLGDTQIPSNCHGFWVLPFGVETVGHGGNTAGCSSYLLLSLQEGIGVVVMTNQANEEIYNGKMMELIFGKFDEETYFGGKRKMPAGVYRAARTVRKGPYKVMSLSFLMGEWEADECWDYVKAGGVEKICYPYGDYYRVLAAEFVGEMASVLLWGISLLFSILSLAVKFVRMVVYKIRHKKVKIVLGRWSVCAAVSQLLSLLLMASVAYKAMNYAVGSTYRWMFGAFGLLGIFVTLMSVFGIVRLVKEKSSKVRKIYNGATALLLVSTAVNIAYWNLFMFWAM